MERVFWVLYNGEDEIEEINTDSKEREPPPLKEDQRGEDGYQTTWNLHGGVKVRQMAGKMDTFNFHSGPQKGDPQQLKNLQRARGKIACKQDSVASNTSANAVEARRKITQE